MRPALLVRSIPVAILAGATERTMRAAHIGQFRPNSEGRSPCRHKPGF